MSFTVCHLNKFTSTLVVICLLFSAACESAWARPRPEKGKRPLKKRPGQKKGNPLFIFQADLTLKRLIAEAEEDIQKAEGGNKAAGTRVRKTMQDIKNAAQDVRKKILELRDDG